MTFQDWINTGDIGIRGLSKIAGLDRGTIRKLLLGAKPQARTLQKLVATTKQMKVPITKEMFK